MGLVHKRAHTKEGKHEGKSRKKKNFQLRKAARRQYWETVHFILLCNKKEK